MVKSPEQIAKRLCEFVRGDVKADIFARAAYSTDASIYQIVPGCVVMPVDSADVASVVKYAKDNEDNSSNDSNYESNHGFACNC